MALGSLNPPPSPASLSFLIYHMRVLGWKAPNVPAIYVNTALVVRASVKLSRDQDQTPVPLKLQNVMGNARFPSKSGVKNPAANAGDRKEATSNPEPGRFPRRRAWQPSPVFLPGESHGQRSLAGYSPWGHKQSDMTEVT